MTKPVRREGYAHAPATVRLGDLEVQRLGYGAMRLPGKDVWGEPEDPDRTRKVLRRAVDLGINFMSAVVALLDAASPARAETWLAPVGGRALAVEGRIVCPRGLYLLGQARVPMFSRS